MSINKITSAPTPNEHIAKTNEVVDFCNNLVIPTVGNGKITITQGGTIKGTFTTNQGGNTTIALDGGSGGSATDVQINGTSITSNNVANIVTNTAYNSTNNKIATMSDVPTNNNQLTNGAGYITGINSSDVTTALGFTPANTTLSNLSSTSCTNFDGQWVNSYKEIWTSVAAGDFTVNLGTTGTNPKNYLPQDNYSYLVQFVSYAANASGPTATLRLVMENNVVTLNSANKGSYSNNSFFVVVDSLRSFDMTMTTGFSSLMLYAIGYRRIGTNT
jgi:hypothetical protein